MNAKYSKLLLCLGSLALVGCTTVAGEPLYFGKLVPAEENLIKIANGAEPRSFDPHKSAGLPESRIFNNVFEGLTDYHPKTLAPTPAVALRWEPDATARVWTFYLRKDARFSDGKPVTANDFVYSWRRIVDPMTASPYASLMYYVKNAQAIAEAQVRLQDETGKFVRDPKNPALPLLATETQLKQAQRLLSLQPTVALVPVAKSDSEHAGQFQLKDQKTGQLVPVAEGAEPDLYIGKDEWSAALELGKLAGGKKIAPFKLEELGVKALDDHTLRIEMQKPTAFFPKMTPHYAFAIVPRHSIEKYGDAWTKPENFVGNGAFKITEARPYDQITLQKSETYWDRDRVKLDKVQLIPVQEESQNANLYRAGEVDAVVSGSLPAPLIRELRQYKDFQGGPQFSTYYYSLNVKRKPFDDIRVRRALNLATDKEAIAYRFVGRGEIPATTFVPPGIAGYKPPVGPKYDPDKARKLLAEAGFPGGKGFPPITIYYNTQEGHRTIAQAVQQMWKAQLRINVQLQNEEWQTFQARRERRDFDVARDAWVGDYMDPSTFLDLMSEDTLNNHPGWVDPKYSRLMTQANSEPNEQKRNKLLYEAEEYLIDQAPIVPVYFYALNYMKKPWLEGWYPNLLDQHPFKYVSINRDWRKQPTLVRQP